MSNHKNRYYQGPVSDHFDGVRFFNPGGSGPKTLRDVLRWRFGERRDTWPKIGPNSGPNSGPTLPGAPPSQRVTDLTITMVGHATLLIQTAGLNVLTDPVWSDRVSPVRFAGPRRFSLPGIPFDALPPIDAILLTHSHYDHLDLKTLRRLKATHDPVVLTPLGNDTILRDGGTGLRCQVGDWGEHVDLGPLRIHFKPCHHWSARGLNDRSMALWAAFVIEGPAGVVYHIGDTGYDDGRPYRAIAADHGPLRAAILPIGAYEPRWFMRDQHQNPLEAVMGFKECGAAYAIGHHWGTFQLTDEAQMAPSQALSEALAMQDVEPDRFRALIPGEAWDIPAIAQ